MKPGTVLLMVLTAVTVMATPAVSARGYHKHFRGHGYYQARHYGSPPARFRHCPPRPVDDAPPVHFQQRPPRPVYYAPPVVYPHGPVYGDRYDRAHSRGSATWPIVAGGIIGGIVGNETGYGNPAAIIGGSVLGSVLGHEIARR